MDCRSCGVDLPHDAAFCPHCGERVELGSVLGVGTDLPSATAPVPPAAPPGDHPVDLGQTAELPRRPLADSLREPSPGASAPASGGAGHSRASILAMVATFVVLTLVGTFALTRIIGSDAPEVGAAASSALSSGAASGPGDEGSSAPSEPASPTEPATPTESASGATVTPTPTPTQTPTPSVTPSESAASIPQGARRCSTSGSDSVATAFAGTERTSCEFAAAVRDAFREAGSPDEATSLRAFSPVTRKWYSLTCDGGEPVRCTSTTNAVVLLAP